MIITNELTQSEHNKPKPTIKPNNNFQISTTEMPRKKGKAKEKETPAISSNQDKEIKKKKKETKEKKMKLDKELEDLTKH